jgi:tetratricopeptide (TPR) repeat protein
MDEPRDIVESPEALIQRWLKGEVPATQLFGFSPEVTQSLAEHGYTLYEQGRYRRARVIFEGLAALDADNIDFQRMLGSIYQIEGIWDAAYYRYTKVLALLATDIFALTNRGEVLLQLGRNEEAIQDLKKAISLDRSGFHPAARRARILLGR